MKEKDFSIITKKKLDERDENLVFVGRGVAILVQANIIDVDMDKNHTQKRFRFRHDFIREYPQLFVTPLNHQTKLSITEAIIRKFGGGVQEDNLVAAYIAFETLLELEKDVEKFK